MNKCAKPRCASAGPFKRCSRCKQAAYCSRDCQVAHYKAHKAACKKWANKKQQEQPQKQHDLVASLASVMAFAAVDEDAVFKQLGSSKGTKVSVAELAQVVTRAEEQRKELSSLQLIKLSLGAAQVLEAARTAGERAQGKAIALRVGKLLEVALERGDCPSFQVAIGMSRLGLLLAQSSAQAKGIKMMRRAVALAERNESVDMNAAKVAKHLRSVLAQALVEGGLVSGYEEEAVELMNKEPPKGAVEALGRLGQQSFLLGRAMRDRESAAMDKRIFKQAAELLKTNLSEIDKVSVRLTLCDAYVRSGSRQLQPAPGSGIKQSGEGAVRGYRQALQVLEGLSCKQVELQITSVRAKVLAKLAHGMSKALGRHEEALKLAEQSVEIYDKTGIVNNMTAAALNITGGILLELKRRSEAHVMLHRALHVCEQLDPGGLTGTENLLQLAIDALKHKELDDAEGLFFELYQRHKKLPPNNLDLQTFKGIVKSTRALKIMPKLRRRVKKDKSLRHML